MKINKQPFLLLCLTLLVMTQSQAADFREVSFKTSDGGRIYANDYGSGQGHAVVLAHGAVFDKESWSALALVMKKNGLRALAIDFRGYGKSVEGSEKSARHLDILGAIAYLKANGAKRVSVLGGSMGGRASGQAATQLEDGAIDRLVLLANPPIESPEKLTGNKLFVVSEGDRLSKSVKAQYATAPKPKQLKILPGDAHAQHIFKTEQGPVLEKLILDFLTD